MRINDIKSFINRLFEFPSTSLFDIILKNLKKIVIILIPMMLGIIFLLGWISAKEVREVVIEDFNQQQLLIAKHAAEQIENNLNSLKRELSLLSMSPSVQYFEKTFMSRRMAITFSHIREKGALELRYIEFNGLKTHVVDNNGYQTMHPYSDETKYLIWAEQTKENKTALMITNIEPVIYGSNYQKLIMKMMMPVWQVSVDEANPVATNKFSGVLIFTIDVTALTGAIIKNIRSGKTGYAWVIDGTGVFLHHPETNFIGKSAFEARQEKKPSISFSRINVIQKEMMLTGKEGKSWYTSGWHRGQEGEIKKLIAYTPVNLAHEGSGRIWSVAVVSPEIEVESVIRSIQIGQFLLEGFIILIVLFGGFLIIIIMGRWSTSLSEEVAKKTKELKKSEHRYRSLIENANDIIFTVDRNGVITSINNAGLLLFGKKKEEIIGLNIGEICFNEESAALQLKAVDKVFEERTSTKIAYPINIRGDEYWLSSNLSPLFDETGNIYAVLSITRDITLEKKRAIEEQMYHTEKLASMGTLAAGVAHEINNPLALILGFSDILIEKVKPDSTEYDMLKTIEKHALNAKRVVENLLSFARYTEHKEEYIDINSNIETVLTVVENTLKLNNISLNCRLLNNLPKVKADAGEMQQVFLNIINNAIYVMKAGGVLTVTTELSDSEQVIIRFADTGHGIKKEHRTKIFDPLFTTKKVGEGTGLGLSVSYGIVTKYGGTIKFETKTKHESEDTGTTFIITLPAVKTVNSEQ